MYKEIGSEFWDIPVSKEKNDLFPTETQWFLSGRSALKAIIQDIKCRRTVSSVALPSWCCDSQIIPFIEAGISVIFYEALKPISKIDSDILMVMDYFGYVSKSIVTNFDGIIIRDMTHSVFTEAFSDADYYFGSLRKWTGFWTGGFAWGFKRPITYSLNDSGYVSLRETAMLSKKNYINNIYHLDNESSGEKTYLSVFANAEELLESLDILPASYRDIELAKYLDLKLIKEKRRENAKILLEAFSEIAVFPEVGNDDCPLFVPIMVSNRDELRKFLIQNQIYCPVHWPITEYHKLSESSQLIYASEISLVCDQRYSADEMKYIVKKVKQFFKES